MKPKHLARDYDQFLIAGSRVFKRFRVAMGKVE